MAWTQVQKSAAVNGTTTGTTTPALPAPSAAGNLLVAFLGSATGGTAFTGPAGWIPGPAVANGAANRAEIWYFPANPGGISSAAFTSGAGTVRGMLAEFSSSSAAAVATDSAGTGTANTAAQVTVTASSPNSAGDLGVACFIEHTATAAPTWTTPANWTAVQAETASATYHAAGYYDLSVAAGTLAVTGQTGTTSASASGWAGVSATFIYVTTLAGSSASSGALGRAAAMTLAGAGTSAGSLARAASRAFAGTAVTSGALARRAARQLAAAGLGSGTLARACSRTWQGAAATSGTLVRAAARTLAASAASAGSTARALSVTLRATAAPAGAWVRAVAVRLAAAAASAGAAAFIPAVTPHRGTAGGSDQALMTASASDRPARAAGAADQALMTTAASDSQ
jgi:hypothetical protein